MKKTFYFILLLLISLKVDAQIGMSESQIREYYNDETFFTSYDYNNKIIGFSEENNYHVAYMLDENGFCIAIYSYPGSKEKLTELLKNFNEKTTPLTENSWRYYEGKRIIDVSLILKDDGETFFVAKEHEEKL